MSNLKEALDNGWNDRLFQYYKDLVNPNAVRPQNEYGQEWNDILGTLRGIATPAPIPTVKPKPTPTPKVEEPKEESND